MKVEWIELEPYYTYKTCYPATEVKASFDNTETQNMEYDCIIEKIKRYKKKSREGNLSIFYIIKYWRFYKLKTCIIRAIEEMYKCNVYKLI